MKKIKAFLMNAKVRAAVAAPALAAGLAMAVSADDGETAASGSSAVVTALSNSVSTIASDAMSVITTIVPIALPILGAGIVLFFGIKLVKKITGRAG